MYKEEKRTITHPDGTTETTVKTEHNESGLFEFCMSAATITICILSACYVASDIRRLDQPIQQPQTDMRSHSEP